MYGILLLLHILGATIWTGGHIIVSVTVLPRALRQGAPEVLLNFESMFEKIGMPALVVQIITGPILAYRFLPDIGQWFNKIGRSAWRERVGKYVKISGGDVT